MKLDIEVQRAIHQPAKLDSAGCVMTARVLRLVTTCLELNVRRQGGGGSFVGSLPAGG